jgi:hypothetical protein
MSENNASLQGLLARVLGSHLPSIEWRLLYYVADNKEIAWHETGFRRTDNRYMITIQSVVQYSLRLDRKRENARVQANPQNFLNLRQNRLVTDLSVNHQNRVLKEGATQDVRGRVDIPRSSEFS